MTHHYQDPYWTTSTMESKRFFSWLIYVHFTGHGHSAAYFYLVKIGIVILQKSLFSNHFGRTPLVVLTTVPLVHPKKILAFHTSLRVRVSGKPESPVTSFIVIGVNPKVPGTAVGGENFQLPKYLKIHRFFPSKTMPEGPTSDNLSKGKKVPSPHISPSHPGVGLFVGKICRKLRAVGGSAELSAVESAFQQMAWDNSTLIQVVATQIILFFIPKSWEMIQFDEHIFAHGLVETTT